jgi:hypothetical protein
VEQSFKMGHDRNGGVVSPWSVPFFGLVEHWILGGQKKLAGGLDTVPPKQGGNKKMKNKKSTGNNAKQKEDEAWKKVPPKARENRSKEVGKYTYHCCKHHMA